MTTLRRSPRRLTLSRRESLWGRVFVLPFYIGFLLFFARPIVETFTIIFHQVTIEFGGFGKTFVGMQNLLYAFTEDPDFKFNLLESVRDMLVQLPAVVFIGLFLAMLIHSRFRGRTFVRAVFFLPVIVVTGTVITILQEDVVASAALSGQIVSGGKIEYSAGLEGMLVSAGMPQQVVTLFTDISNSAFNLLWKTGVQIVIFLAGLQSIPSSLYEASAIEGATEWENFFRITLPMLLPIIQVNTVYTIVDSFTDANNKAMNQVMVAVSNLRMGTASAMAWSFFALIAVFIVCVMLIFARLNKRYA